MFHDVFFPEKRFLNAWLKFATLMADKAHSPLSYIDCRSQSNFPYVVLKLQTSSRNVFEKGTTKRVPAAAVITLVSGFANIAGRS